MHVSDLNARVLMVRHVTMSTQNEVGKCNWPPEANYREFIASTFTKELLMSYNDAPVGLIF